VVYRWAAIVEATTVHLVNRWRAGDEAAAAELFDRYAARLVALAGRGLTARVATRVAPEDVVQSVYFSFFAGAKDGRFILRESGDLWRLLAAITLNKTRRQVVWHSATKRAVGAETDNVADALARDPSPAEAAALTDTVEALLRATDPAHRPVLELRLQGYGVPEIVAATGRSRASVRRVLERVKETLSRLDPAIRDTP
jgi:RNA polymerase sigma-70 factor (ECF subfamily)